MSAVPPSPLVETKLLVPAVRRGLVAPPDRGLEFSVGVYMLVKGFKPQ